MDFANPTFEKMARNWFESFCTNPVLSLLLTLTLVFYFAGGRHGGLLVDRLRMLSTHDRRSKVVSSLTPVMTKEYITFGDNGKGRVLSVVTVKVSKSMTLRRVSLVKPLGYNLLFVSQLLDEGYIFHHGDFLGSYQSAKHGDYTCLIYHYLLTYPNRSLRLM
jgi:hypothetical protein